MHHQQTHRLKELHYLSSIQQQRPVLSRRQQSQQMFLAPKGEHKSKEPHLLSKTLLQRKYRTLEPDSYHRDKHHHLHFPVQYHQTSQQIQNKTEL